MMILVVYVARLTYRKEIRGLHLKIRVWANSASVISAYRRYASPKVVCPFAINKIKLLHKNCAYFATLRQNKITGTLQDLHKSCTILAASLAYCCTRQPHANEYD